MLGKVFDIQRFSVHDGYGIRTTVFLKGCNNRCAWCHNPESISNKTQLFIRPSKCIGCGQCQKQCELHKERLMSGRFDYTKCKGCGCCAEECYAGCITICGKEMTSDEVFKEILKDKAFYDESGGGVTLSGGEPLMQPHFCIDILRKCKENNINTAIQTAGSYHYELIEPLIMYLSFIMFDIKTVNQDTAERYIKYDTKTVLETLNRISTSGVDFAVRTPVVGGVNDTEEEIAGIVDAVSSIDGIGNLGYYQLIPYHDYGLSKQQNLTLVEARDSFYTPNEQKMEFLRKIASTKLINVR